MRKLISRGKMSKKARKALHDRKRVTWGFAPVTRRVESGKRYRRSSGADRKRWESPGDGSS